MNTKQKILKAATDPCYAMSKVLIRCSKLIPSDELYLRLLYFLEIKKPLHLNPPRTYREKLQWLKLHYHNPLMQTMVDKCEAKEYVASKIGAEHVVPMLGVWDNFDDIDFSKLPDRFVLKCTHDSGSYYIVDNKSTMDMKAARRKINRGLRRDYYPGHREWPYKGMKHRVIAEQYLENGGSEGLTDYKLFCFNGEPKLMYISHDIADHAHTDFVDMQGKHLKLRMKDPNSFTPPQLPAEFAELQRLARILSQGLPHVRVDFYIVSHHIYFGELTFFHNGGFFPLEPEEWDRTIGDWLKLPE